MRLVLILRCGEIACTGSMGQGRFCGRICWAFSEVWSRCCPPSSPSKLSLEVPLPLDRILCVYGTGPLRHLGRCCFRRLTVCWCLHPLFFSRFWASFIYID